MKKFLVILFSLLSVVSCAFGLAACGETHTHEWSQFWEIGETHHWHNCTTIDCPVTDNSLKDGYAPHDFSNGNCVCGKFASIAFVLNDDNASYSAMAGMGIDNETEIIIPAECNGKPVTSIGQSAFEARRSLTSVTIPDSVTSIGQSAFSSCSGLTSITIPDSVTSISEYAFSYCSSLTSITIPDSVTVINDNVFIGCSSLTSVTIPNSVTSIGESAFRDCSSLTSITIPDKVTEISGSTFSGCSSLTSITIPDGVTDIRNSAFSSCSKLTSVTIPVSVKFIGSSAFGNCSSLTSITFNGTMEQWETITKYYWNKNTGNYTVYCTNGNLRKPIEEN